MDTELPLAINYKGIVKIVAIIALALPTLVLVFRISCLFFRGSLQTPFTRICYCAVVTDMFSFFLDLVAWDLASAGIFPFYAGLERGFLPVALNLGQTWARNFEFCCMALVASNRYTALYWMGARGDGFWRTALVPLLVGSQLLSVSFAVIYSIAGAYYFAAARYTWYLAAGLNRFPGLSSGIWCLGMNCIVVTIALVFNGLVVRKLFQIRGARKRDNVKVISRAERKLCFVSLYSYLFVLIYIGSQCCNTWLEEKDKDLTHFLAPLSSQLLCLSTVWICGQIGDGDTSGSRTVAVLTLNERSRK
ncbi:unnamed protein product, partial [Mesorhabditis spiculigera]